MLNEISLNRNTHIHKTKLYVDSLTKKVVTRGLQAPNTVFPLQKMVQYSLIQCFQSLWSLATRNNENQLYFLLIFKKVLS